MGRVDVGEAGEAMVVGAGTLALGQGEAVEAIGEGSRTRREVVVVAEVMWEEGTETEGCRLRGGSLHREVAGEAGAEIGGPSRAREVPYGGIGVGTIECRMFVCLLRFEFTVLPVHFCIHSPCLQSRPNHISMSLIMWL